MAHLNFRNFIKTLGPGILFAGAAIGGSHLVQSTRAGASYGFDLLFIVILINLFKYPFFEFGNRYTAATGESILQGYAKLGKSTLWVFYIMNIFTSVINGAAVTLVTAGLCANLFGLNLPPATVSLIILAIVTIVLFVGRYAVLDSVMKVMITVLAIATIITVFVALGIETSFPDRSQFAKPDLWSAAGIAFLLALMGWMPAPIEISVWPSLWALERSKQTHYQPTLKEALLDFHIGYIGTTVIAIFFVGLGALVMFGSGEVFSNNSVIFSSQLVSLYTKTIGEWSRFIIAAIVFTTMLSTTLTVFDAYPRTLAGSLQLLSSKRFAQGKFLYHIWALLMVIAAFVIITGFTSGIKTLMDFATIIAFLAAPVFAVINYRVVTAPFMPVKYQPPKWLRILSWSGIIFLIAFSLLYIVSILF